MTETRVMIVEDEALVAMALESDLGDFGYIVVGVSATADHAVRQARETRPDVILMDVRLKGERDGVDAALEIRDMGLRPAVIFVTGSREPATQRRIREDHPADLLLKPVTPEQIDAAIGEALRPVD
jgi:CheY-like chemotaxis protein